MVLNGYLDISMTGNFDTYASSAASADLLGALQALPLDSLVVLLAKDEAANNLGADVKSYLSANFGAAQAQSLGYAESYGLIGYKGAPEPLAEERHSMASVAVSASVTCGLRTPAPRPTPRALTLRAK